MRYSKETAKTNSSHKLQLFFHKINGRTDHCIRKALSLAALASQHFLVSTRSVSVISEPAGGCLASHWLEELPKIAKFVSSDLRANLCSSARDFQGWHWWASCYSPKSFKTIGGEPLPCKSLVWDWEPEYLTHSWAHCSKAFNLSKQVNTYAFWICE